MSYFTSTHSLIVIILCFLTGGCSQRALQDARETVHQADSLWHAGQMYDDSAALAQTYETLDAWRYFYADDYAHACYHYGKLLRAKEDPVSAMQAFIHATHSRTRDYHILGRIYNNMGAICHLAGEFPLSYEMFEKSGDMFLREQDTLSYYYCLNDMAFELAEQGKKKEALSLLTIIEKHSIDTHLLSMARETEAVMYFNTQQYDSVLFVIDNSPIIYPAGYAFKARALWHLDQSDSALFYAQKVLSFSDASKQEQYNMLYIILNEDSTLQNEEIKAVSEQRADIEHKMLVPLHKRYAVATKVLRLDIEKTPICIYILITISLAAIVIVSLMLYSKYIHKKNFQQQEILRIVREEQSQQLKNKQQEINEICMAIRSDSNWQQTINWKDYKRLCEFIDKHLFFFAHRLKVKNVLNEKEVRLCILILIGGFSDKQMADFLYYAENSIRGIKRYTAKKLGTSSANLRQFLMQMLVAETIH